MRRFADLSIRRKLLLLTLASSATALVLATTGFVVWDVYQLREEIKSDMTTQARLVGDNAAATIAFRDERAAGETLAALQLRPHVALACLYSRIDASGVPHRLFAVYRRDGTATCPASPPPTAFSWNTYDISVPVAAANDVVGTLYLQRELTDLYDRMRVGVLTIAGLLLLATGASFATAAGLQRAIAAPLLHLADTARRISSSRDYSLRAVPGAGDEVGVVVYAFNDMLDRIAERTSELSKANADLEREVEERKRVEAERTAALERERDANRLKDEFLATLSHELRTPLNAVLGWTRVLRATRVEPATQERALESIERNARAQARLIEDLLEISRIVTGKLRLQVTDTDLAAIVEAAVAVVQPAAAAKRLEVIVEIEQRPAMTSGDPDRLQQIVWNLLSNAVKFTPPEGRIWVRLERRHGYRLTVRDTGAGIDPKFLPFVFEAFRQADGSTSREHGGLGLGLAIARQLVELHGGTISVFSPGLGAGATFEINLPSVILPTIASSPDETSHEPLPPPEIQPSLLAGVHVLVVDDEEDARALLATSLTSYGASVTTVSSVNAAMTAIGEHVPDIVISDIGMPHEDGFAFIRRLRQLEPLQGGAAPAIAITAYASDTDRRAVESAGYQAHVAKPFEPAEVAALVARFARSATDTSRVH